MSAENISGWSDVVAWFGDDYDFHDAEVMSIDLRRDPEPSIVRIASWNIMSLQPAPGDAVISFILTDIRRQELKWWNLQNVLQEAWVEVDQEDGLYCLILRGTHGVEGVIGAKSVRVEISGRE